MKKIPSKNLNPRQMRIEFEERRRKFLARREKYRQGTFGTGDAYRRLERLRKPNLDPEKSVKLHKIAEIYSQLNMDDEALEVGRQAYRANPKNQSLVESLSKHYATKGRFHAAIRYAEELCKLHNGEIEGRFLLGTYYFSQNNWQLAKKYLLWVIEHDGKWIRPMPIDKIHCTLATCCKELDDDAGSLMHLTKALEFAPRNSDTLFQLGLHYGEAASKHQHQWGYANSSAEGRKIIKKKQTVESPVNTYFDNLTKSKQFFNKSAKIKPTAAVYNNLANTLSLLNKHPEALTVIEKALRIEPTPSILTTKAMIQLRTSNKFSSINKPKSRMRYLTVALDIVNQALRLDSEHLEAVKLKSFIQDNLEDWAGYYESNWHIAQLSEDPNEKEMANVNMAISWMQRRDFKQANSILDKYLKENPTSHSALHRKFDCAMETKKFSKALTLANKMYKIDPDAHTEQLKVFALEKLDKRKDAFSVIIKLANYPDLDPIIADFILDRMYNYAHSFTTRNKKNIPIIRSACKKIEKRLGKYIIIQHAVNELLNWINAINGKEKEFDRLYIKIKKVRMSLSKGSPAWISNFANKDYNYACAFALSGNTKKTLQFLKTAIKSDQKYRKLAKKDKDFQNLFESKTFIELTHETKNS